MPTAHLIHGYLGAGKTTLAHRLEREFAAVRFSHDEWMSRLYGDDPPLDGFAEGAARVRQLMHPIWTRCITLGVDVILDFGFWARRERDQARSELFHLGAACRLYRLEAPDDVAWDRIMRRNADLRGSLFIARETFGVLKSRFEPLGADEARIEVPSCWKDDPWTPRP